MLLSLIINHRHYNDDIFYCVYLDETLSNINVWHIVYHYYLTSIVVILYDQRDSMIVILNL